MAIVRTFLIVLYCFTSIPVSFTDFISKTRLSRTPAGDGNGTDFFPQGLGTGTGPKSIPVLHTIADSSVSFVTIINKKCFSLSLYWFLDLNLCFQRAMKVSQDMTQKLGNDFYSEFEDVKMTSQWIISWTLPINNRHKRKNYTYLTLTHPNINLPKFKKSLLAQNVAEKADNIRTLYDLLHGLQFSSVLNSRPLLWLRHSNTGNHWDARCHTCARS